MKKDNTNWQVKPLGEITEIVTGGTPSTAIKEYWEEGEIPWLNSGELNQGIVTSSSNYITQQGLKNSVTKLMPPDTVLIALTGATTGRVGYLTFEACANQSVTGILPSVHHDPKFLYYHLQSLRKQILKVAWGGAQKHIHQKFVKDLKIPLPPLPIQKQIAEILEKADDAKQKRKEVNMLTDEFLQSVFIEMFGDPVKNPKRWNEKKLCEYFIIEPQNGIYKPSSDYGHGTRILRIDSVYDGKVYNISNLKRLKLKPEEIKKYGLVRNDIVINRVNSIEYLGKCGLIPYLDEPVVFESNLMRFSVDVKKIDPIYLVKLLTTNYIRLQILRAAKDAVNQSSINQQDVYSFRIIVPPLELQQKFAEIVSKTESLKEKQKQSEQELENLFQSLMQKAFKGELV